MRTLILGCGRIGAGLAQRLGLAGHEVTVVDPAPGALALLPGSFRGRRLVGDALDRRVLEQAEVAHQDALAAVTASDNVNIVAARLARLQFRVPRVVARVYNPLAGEIYHRLGIQTVTTSAWGINRIAELLSYSELEPVASLGSEVDILDLRAPPLLVGRPISSISRPGEIQVAAISRGARTFLPQPGTLIEDDDLLHLVVLASATDHLVGLLRA